MGTRRAPTVFNSFNYAIEGIIHVLRTQRNMRIHFLVAAVVLVVALLENVTKIELISLLLAIAFVLIAEMINTAIEGAIDVATSSFDPMAKLAKDIAAGAVLIAAISTAPAATSFASFAIGSNDVVAMSIALSIALLIISAMSTNVIEISSAISSKRVTFTSSASTTTASAIVRWMRMFRCVRSTWMIPSIA